MLQQQRIPPDLLGRPPGMAQAMAPNLMGSLGIGGPQAAPPQNGAYPADDPVLAQMSTLPAFYEPYIPGLETPEELKPGYMPPMDAATWREIANIDKERYTGLLHRFSRDVGLYRQRLHRLPPGFDRKREIAYKAATISNIVNKLANMCAPMDFRYVVPFKDDISLHNSQTMENAYAYWRDCEKIEYAHSGGTGTLQWDEFFYLFLYGRLVRRILPNRANKAHPFRVDLIDPSTVFPVWGGSSEGLIRITHRRNMSALDVISTYLPVSQNLSERLQESVIKDMGYDYTEIRKFFHVERELTEGYDTWNQWAQWGDVELYNRPHRLGEVPWVYTMAKGEPRGMATPEGRYLVDSGYDDEDPETLITVSEKEDLAEKGVSVFHHIINSHRMVEVVQTILINEVLKSADPPTLTTSPQTMAGKPPSPIVYKRGATNQRTIPQKTEIAPTSPHPTDVAPVMNALTGDIVQGSINPAMFGSVEGSNIAGFAIESMIAAAKDTVLPYFNGFEVHHGQVAGLQYRLYRDQILPMGVSSTPTEGKYGSAPSVDLTAEVIASTTDKVMVEMIGVSQQQLPMLVNAAGAAVERGFWSRRKAMETLGEKDPSKMLQDIIIERSLEHPEMMENYLIPVSLIKNGQKDMAELWVLLVVMPKVQMLMQKMMGPMGGGMGGGMMPPGGGGAQGPPGLGGLPEAPPELNGQSNPIAMRDRGAPTGPQPGQGRGPAPA